MAVKGTLRIDFKWNRKTAEVRTWIAGSFTCAERMEIGLARERLGKLYESGFVVTEAN